MESIVITSTKTRVIKTLCPTVLNPFYFRYLGEGFEAIVFDFECQQWQHQPCPHEHSIQNINVPNVNTPIQVQPLCIHDIGELVLRIPKIDPTKLLVQAHASHANNNDDMFSIPHKKDYDTICDDLDQYFSFKTHVISQILPKQLIPHEFCIILPVQFIIKLYAQIENIRPLKRQKEYNISNTIARWRELYDIPFDTSSLNDAHIILNNEKFINNRFIKCLLMQDFTKHRILHRAANVVNPKECAHMEQSNSNNTLFGSYGAGLTPDAPNIHTFSNITISYELKPKWGYQRQSKCFPTSIPDTPLPHGDAQIKINDNNHYLALPPHILQNIQQQLFFHLCRTCALRIQRESPSSDRAHQLSNHHEPAHFCPLDLYSVAQYVPDHPDQKSDLRNGVKQSEQNKTIRAQLDTAIVALFSKPSANLRCSIHHYIIHPMQMNHQKNPREIVCNNFTTNVLSLQHLLTNVLLTPPLINFFKALRMMQLVLDDTGPNYGGLFGCTCDRSRSKSSCSDTHSPFMQLTYPQWGRLLRQFIPQQMQKYMTDKNNPDFYHFGPCSKSHEEIDSSFHQYFFSESSHDRMSTDVSKPRNHHTNSNTTITYSSTCEQCVRRLALTSSMTIKDLSFYLSITPVEVKNVSTSTLNLQHSLLLHDESIPILSPNALNWIKHVQTVGVGSDDDILNFSSLLSPHGYFLYPYHSLFPENAAPQSLQIDLQSAQSCAPSYTISSLHPVKIESDVEYEEQVCKTAQICQKDIIPTTVDLSSIPILGSVSTQDNKLESRLNFNYLLCRIQCGDIGPKPNEKYQKYIQQEQQIVSSNINLLHHKLKMRNITDTK